MIPNLPVLTHIDLVNEFNRKRPMQVPEDPSWISALTRERQQDPSLSLAQRTFQRLAATFGRIRHRHPAQGESRNGAAAHYASHSR